MTGLLVILTIGLAAVVLTWLAEYLFARRCRERYSDQSRRLRHYLAMIDTDLSLQERAAEAYPPDSPEPYGLLAQDLRTRLQRARAEWQAGQDDLLMLERATPVLPAPLARRLAAVYYPYPRLWWAQLRQIDAIARRSQALQSHISRIQSSLDQLGNVPADLARRARGLAGAAERIGRIGESLRQSGVVGGRLDAELENAKAFIAELQTLPLDPAPDREGAPASPASRARASENYLKLKQIERPLYDCLRHLQTWQSQFAEARNMVGAMLLEIGAAERILRETPPQLDVFDHTAELQALKRAAREIEDRQMAVDVEALPGLSNDATQQALRAKELTAHLMSLHKTFQSVEQVATTNGRVLARIQSGMDELAHSPDAPVAWTHSAAERDRLVEAHARIIGGESQRGAARLKVDLDTGVEVGLHAQALDAEVNRVGGLHRQLIELMHSPELGSPNEWFQDVATTHIAVSAYAPENWPAADSVTTLRADAVALAERGRDLAPLLARQPVAEEQLPAWINLAGAYVRSRQAMQARLAHIELTLGQVEAQDASARQVLAGATRALGDLAVDSAQLTPGTRPAARWEELVETWRRGERLAETLDRRDAGRVADKALSVESWARQCATAVGAWAIELLAETERARAALRASVSELTAIAPFDMEPAMRAALEWLESPPPARPGEAAPAALEAAVALANEAWRLLTGIGEAATDLDLQIDARVDTRPARLEEERGQAWDRLAQLDKLRRQIPDIKAMPVAPTDADQLRQDYQQAETALDDVSHNGRTVRAVVARLDSLIQQYQYIASRGALVQSDMEGDVGRLRQSWAQFSHWARQLKRYRDQHSQDEAVAAAVEERLDEISRFYDDLQRRYKGRPVPLNYAWQELDSAYNRVCRELEVSRDGQTETVSPRTIEVFG